MIPWSLVIGLATLGTPKFPADRELQVRAAAVCPSVSCMLKIGLSPEGVFSWGEETDEASRAAHRPLKLKSRQFGGPVAGIEALLAFAGDDTDRTALGISIAYAGIGLCQARLDKQSDDAASMTCLGKFLDDVGQPGEAERWLRNATRTAPHEWRTWDALAAHHMQSVNRLMRAPFTDPKALQVVTSNPERLADLVRDRFAGNPEIQRCLHDAGDCYDRAVESAPREVEPYLARIDWNCQTAMFGVLSARTEDELEKTNQALSTRSAADARKIAELTNHPSAYGLTLMYGGHELADASSPSAPAARQYFEQAASQLEAMRRDADPLVRADAGRVLILYRCLVAKDFAGARKLLDDLADRKDDRIPMMLAALVFKGLNDRPGLADWADRKWKPTTALDYFILATCRAEAGRVTRAHEALREGLQKFPDDVRLNLICTGLLLQYGTAADLPQVHLRLVAVEAGFAARLSSPVPWQWWDKDDRALFQLVRLHRAVYLAMSGNTTAARAQASEAEGLSEDQAEAAHKLADDLGPESSFAKDR